MLSRDAESSGSFHPRLPRHMPHIHFNFKRM
jgi:hypothetical protein